MPLDPGGDAREAEARVRRKLDEGDAAAAVTEALRAVGPEIMHYLFSLHRDGDDAGDAFSGFAEQLWRALPAFRWACSLRSLSYRIARNASVDFRRARGAVARRASPLSECPAVAAMAERVRTETLTFLRTESRDAVDELRRTLTHDDQTLLLLRLDQKLAWADLARVFLGDPDPPEDAVKRESARLRKRFQLVKEELVALGRARGLLPH